MGAVGGFGVVAEAVDSFRHLLRKYAIRRASMAFGPHRSGRAKKAGTPCHHPLIRRLRWRANTDCPPRSTINPGAAVRAAPQSMQRVSTYQSPGAFWGCRLRINTTADPPPMTRPSVPYRRGKGLWRALCLSCGTSLERIAPESLTRSLSEFVHGHIWWHALGAPQNRVRGKKSRSRPMLKWINGDARLWNWENCRRAASGWTPFAASGWRHLLRFCRRLARLRHRNELGRLHNPEPERGRNRDPIGHHHARACNGGKPELDVAQLHEILDRVALGNVPRDRRKPHRADHRHALVASLRPHPLEPLECELKVVAHTAVEDRQRALASLGNGGVAAARNPNQRRRHGVRHAASVSVGDWNAIRARNGRRIGR